ncbi:NADH-quinone oxidoreductase subunit M [Myxococcota bacterium]|nr:NADH-quinone oxidoreductase subunit M [Myxococcota bacterium]
MSFLNDHLLSVIIFLPLVGALLALGFPRDNDGNNNTGVRGFAIFLTLVDFVLSIVLWTRFDPSITKMQLVESVSWISTFGISYSVGVDGLSILLVILTTFLTPIVILSTYSSVKTQAREYIVLLLFLQTGMLGAFLATDLFLFYVFWEIMLIPMYFLIGIWGGRRRIYAAVKFFLYTMVGSLLMLVAIIYTVLAVKDMGGITFSWGELSTRLAQTQLGGAETWLFLAFALAFAIKVPMFPFHTWLPDAHVEAPTGGSVILAGVLLKLGTFGFLRYALWLFPKAATIFLPAIGILAVIGIIYGALVAMVQTDLKRLVAYSSVAHLGFVMLGIAAMTVTGVTGGVLQMVNHGISTGALFLLVGVLYERRHTRLMADFGGIAKVMPKYAFVFMVIMLSSVGLPGLNGFVGEFLILMGTFQSEGIQIATSTGAMAQMGIWATQLSVLGGLILLGSALWRPNGREPIGNATRIVTLIAATAFSGFLVWPPMASFNGGLLIRPLLTPLDNGESFREMFALLAILATTGVIFAALYLLLATQKVFFGPVKHAANENLKDLSVRESFVLGPLVIVAVFMGVYPQPFLKAIEPTVAAYAQEFRARAELPALAEASVKSIKSKDPGYRRAEPKVRGQGPAGHGSQRKLPWRRTLRKLDQAPKAPKILGAPKRVHTK